MGPDDLFRRNSFRHRAIEIYDGNQVLPSERHELYEFLRSHLDGDDLWNELEFIKKEVPVYVNNCEELLESIKEQAVGPDYAGCHEGPHDGALPCITDSFGELVYYEAVRKAMEDIQPLHEPYGRRTQNETVLFLQLNACEIGYGRDEEELDHLEQAHRKLRRIWVESPETSKIMVRFELIQAAIARARARLEPNLVRMLVYKSQCERCPA